MPELTPTFSVSATYTVNYTGHTGSGAGLRDGVYNTYASTWGSPSGSHYITADLGSAQHVTRIGVASIPSSFQGWGAVYLNTTSIHYSNDNATWTLLTTISGVVDNQLRQLGAKITARYWRISRSSSYIGVGDFRLWQDPSVYIGPRTRPQTYLGTRTDAQIMKGVVPLFL